MLEEQNTNLEEKIVEAFQMMWGRYDEPVRLIHRSFRIVAGNDAYMANGGVTGVKCNAAHPELHKACRAMEALKGNSTKTVVSSINGDPCTSYWIPVSGYPDYYIHFSNGLNKSMSSLNKAAQM